MAITTYDELKTAIGDWLIRQDLAAVTPTFVALAEAQMNRDARLRSMDGMTRTDLVIAGQYTSLPADVLELVNVQVKSPDRVLKYATLYELDEIRIAEPTGIPTHYSLIGTEIEVAPVPTSATTLELTYYGKLPPLSDANPTNWLLQAAPDIYLYASLLQAAPYLHEDERIGVWAASYDRLCEDFARNEERRAYNGAPLVVRARAIGG